MDREILALAKTHRCFYTRYTDDITISTRLGDLPSQIVNQEGATISVGNELAAIITSARFQINTAKLRLQHRSHRLVVTGLKVNRFPNVRKQLISQIRAMLHAWKKFGLQAAEAEFAAKYNTRSRSPFAPALAFRNVLLENFFFLGGLAAFQTDGLPNLQPNSMSLIQCSYPNHRLMRSAKSLELQRAFWQTITKQKPQQDFFLRMSG